MVPVNELDEPCLCVLPQLLFVKRGQVGYATSVYPVHLRIYSPSECTTAQVSCLLLPPSSYRQMLQVEKETDILGYYPTGDPFVDVCLAALKSDSQGRLMPASCPKYSMASPPPQPGTTGCLGQEVVPALKDTLGRQVCNTQ